MKLNFKNFFSHLILHPFSADTKKQKSLALIFSLACFVFSLSVSHIAAGLLKRCFKSKPKGAETATEKKTNSVKTKSLLKPNPKLAPRVRDLEKEKETAAKLDALPKPDPLPRLKHPLTRDVRLPTCHLSTQTATPKAPQTPTLTVLPKKDVVKNSVHKKYYSDEVKIAFNALFSDSAFILDELPSYSVTLSSQNPFPKAELMGDDPVLEGKFDDHRRFIAIQIRFDNSQGQLQKHKNVGDLVKSNYGKLPEIRQILIYAQPFISNNSRLGEPPYEWRQVRGGKLLPSFFTDSDQNPTQKVQLLLKKGKVTDNSGLTWELVK